MRVSFLAVLPFVLAGCASRDLWPVERVDPETAVHVTIMAEPWIYAVDDPRQSANASHFVNVTVVEANRTGTRSYWLNVVSSSTHARAGSAGYAVSGPIQLRWPTGQLQLAAAAGGRRAAGISEPAIRVPGATIGEAWCALSAADLAEFAAGAPTAISLMDADGKWQTFAPWQVDDAAIAEFLKATVKGAY